MIFNDEITEYYITIRQVRRTREITVSIATKAQSISLKKE